ncbi:MAG: hypothetical protein J6U39_02565 [Clostridia bacterium]|nr:hypothetical protein [Clostridia bacterium]
MLRIVYGAKGSGKTSKLIDEANAMVDKTSGNIVFITYVDRYNFDLNYRIRVINATNFGVGTEEQLAGFVKGVMASNSDIDILYIDGAHRITNKAVADLGFFYNEVAKAAKNSAVEIVLSASTDTLPDFLADYESEKVK